MRLFWTLIIVLVVSRMNQGERSPLHFCDFGTGTVNTLSEGGLVLVNEVHLRTEVGQSQGPGISFLKVFNNVMSLEAVTTGAAVGASVCYDGRVMMPMSDTPSCHADQPDTCKWYSTARSIEMQEHYFSNVQGNVFHVTKWHDTFTSHDVNPRLIKVCLHVEYLPGTSGRYSLSALHGLSGEETHLHTVHFNESKRWRVDRVVVDMPTVLPQIKLLKLRFHVASMDYMSSTLVKKLHGCNPHSMVDRFLMPLSLLTLREEFDEDPTEYVCETGFNCDVKRCIPQDWRCDGQVDCEDQSDELNCKSCNEGMIPCGENQCIAQTHLCDGEINCPLGQDERNCIAELGCLNRGLSTADGCRCNVGLYGEKCEKVCGSNRFGPNCEAKCSQKSTECEAMVFCSPGMGCHCAPGWKGYNCNTNCSHGEYGVDCREGCGHCISNSTCNRYSGVCTQGCQPGYVPPHCRTRYAHLTTAAEVKISSLTWIDIGLDYTHEDINGSGDPKFYRVQYKQVGEEQWTGGVLKFVPADHSIRERIDDLTPGTSYHARIILFDERMNAYVGDDLPIVSGHTECNDNPIIINVTEITEWSFTLSLQLTYEDLSSCRFKDYSVEVSTGFSDWYKMTGRGDFRVGGLAPDTKYTVLVRQLGNRTMPMPFYSTYVTTQPSQKPVQMEVFNVTSSGLQIRWDVPNREITYYIIIQCLQGYLLPAARQRECTTDGRQTEVTVTGPGVHNLDINNLRPFTRYSVKIGYSPDGEFSEVESTTDFALEGKVLEVKLVNVNQTDATIEWNEIEECEICILLTDGYLAQLKDDVTGAMKEEVFTYQNHLTLSNLQPANEYTVSVHFVDKNKTIMSEPAVETFLTKTMVPSRVLDLVAYKKSRHTVGLRWAAPEHVYGNISSFTVYYVGKPWPTFISPSVTCPMWPHLFCYTVEGLQPDKGYNFTVTARNNMLDEDGEPATVTAETEECAPEAPTQVKVESVSEKSANVSWGPPNMLNGVLRSFLIKIEQIDSFNASNCCNHYPKVDIPVKEEMQRFDTQISGLTGASTYALSIMAETAWLGPAAKIELSTRPPRPASVVLPVDLTTIRLVASLSDAPHSAGIVWQSQQSYEPNELHQPIERNLLLLVPGTVSDDEAMKNISSNSDGLVNLIEEEIGDDFDILAEYEGDTVSVDVNTVVAEVNVDYRLVAVTAVRYRDVYNIRTLSSQPFSISMENNVTTT